MEVYIYGSEIDREVTEAVKVLTNKLSKYINKKEPHKIVIEMEFPCVCYDVTVKGYTQIQQELKDAEDLEVLKETIRIIEKD